MMTCLSEKVGVLRTQSIGIDYDYRDGGGR